MPIKKLLFTGMAVAFGANLARGDTQSIPVTGQATQICIFTEAPFERGSANMALNASGISNSSASISTMLNADNARLQYAFVAIRFTARCNYPHSVSLTSEKNGMTDNDAPPYSGSDFINRVNYSAKVIWSDTNFKMTTGGSPGSKTVTKVNIPPANGEFDLEIDVSASENQNFAKPVIAGHYTDRITVAIGAPL